ncbi:TPA: hypothetical protein ACQ45G_001018 [Citrobacter freundii]
MSNYLKPGEVRCWKCGEWIFNNELDSADGFCPNCSAEICTDEAPYTNDEGEAAQ